MKLRYNTNNNDNFLISALKIIVFSLLFFVCCLPSFSSIGHFAFQMISAAFLSFVCTAILFMFFKGSLKILANSLTVFLIFLIFIALLQQLKIQLSLDTPFSDGWIYMFYFDKPLTVAVVWGVSFLSATLLRLFTPFSEEFSDLRKDYSYFLNKSINGFVVFYIFILIYCFVIQRSPQTQSGINLIPFNVITTYISNSASAYEGIFYFTGNAVCFFPFGFIYKMKRKEPDFFKTVLLAPVLSLAIELSQLLLKNGNFDVDDIILNSLGFYLGFLTCFCFNKIRSVITKGEEKTIFD